MSWLVEYYQQAMQIGDRHGVNPLIFAGIYVGAIPFFFASVYWIVSRYRQKKSLVLPAGLAGFFFCSAYIYLVLFGRRLGVVCLCYCPRLPGRGRGTRLQASTRQDVRRGRLSGNLRNPFSGTSGVRPEAAFPVSCFPRECDSIDCLMQSRLWPVCR